MSWELEENENAEVVKLVDTQVSGACEISRVGSNPIFCTIDESVRTIRTLIYRINRKIVFFLFLERNHRKGWCL